MKAPAATRSEGKGHKVSADALAEHDEMSSERSSHRHVAYDDCCAYCDVYCVQRLSTKKRQYIDAWTQDVNGMMSSRNNRYDYLTKQNAKKQRREAQLKMQRYTPPGSPDIDEGFRMIPTPASLPSRKSSANSSRSHQSAPALRRQSLVTPDKACGKRADLRIPTSQLSQMTLGDPVRGQAKGHQGHYTQSYRGYTRSEEVERGSVQSDRVNTDISRQLRKSSKTGIIRAHTVCGTFDQPIVDTSGFRTCSNTILNVYSIDDAYPRFHNIKQRDIEAKPEVTEKQTITTVYDNEKTRAGETSTKQVPVSRKSSAKSSSRKMSLIMEENAASSNRSAVSSRRSHRGDDVSINRKTPSSFSASDSLNGTVKSAFSNLENSTKVIHNRAHTGLYRSAKHPHIEDEEEEIKKRKESKRFRKMNRTLKNKMADQYLHGSELSQKIRLRNANSSSANQVASNVGQPDVDSRSYDSQLQQNKHSSRVTFDQSQKGTVHDVANAEHFLEMIMAIDKNGGTAGQNRNLNLQTFVYI